jgi:hypothetical protein
MSQIKFSQKSIQGLPEALAALLAQLNAQGSAGSTALTAAINAEVAARTAADTAISNVLDVVNGASTVEGSFRKAIADVIGSAPEALNTLKEIADYIAVNPNANVADAINAAITAAQQAVADLTAVVQNEKDFADWQAENDYRMTVSAQDFCAAIGGLRTHAAGLRPYGAGDYVTNYVILENSQGINDSNVLNFGTTRFTRLGVSYDLPVFSVLSDYLDTQDPLYGSLAVDISALVAEDWYAESGFDGRYPNIFKIQYYSNGVHWANRNAFDNRNNGG